MASSKVMATMKPKNSDLTSSSSATNRSRRASTSSSGLASASLNTQQSDHFQTFDRNLTASSLVSTMTVDGILRDVYSTPSADSTLLDAQITLLDTPAPLLPTTPPPPPPAVGTMVETTNIINSSNQEINSVVPQTQCNKTVDDVWREIVSGREEMKEEPDEMMTLEDFLAKAGASEEVGLGVGVGQDDDIKMPSGGVYAYDHPVTPSAFQMLDKIEGSIVGFGNGVDVASSGRGHGVGRGKRGRAAAVMEPLDKAAHQRQRRMIKNRESAARSRERKQAYQVELESLAVRLEEENERLLKEKEKRTKERFKQLMEKLVPVVEQRRPPRKIRRVNSLEW